MVSNGSVNQPDPPGSRLRHAPGRGIFYVVLGGAVLTVNDAIIKELTQDFPTGQMLFIRGAISMCLLLAIILCRGGARRHFKFAQPGAQMTRGLLMVVSTYMFVLALSLMPLADAIAITFVGPILLTMLAPMMLGEYVGWRRWLAVSIGFAGMIVMLQPGGGSLQWVALLPLGAAACGAFRDIITRKINAVDTALGTLFVSTALVTFGGLLSLPWGWQPLDLRSAALFLCNGILLTGAHYLLIEALRYAEAAAVSPFKYVSLLWAVLLGYLIWGDVPTLATLLGAGMIVLAGLFIFHREKVKAAR